MTKPDTANRITAIIPARNEEETVGLVVSEVKKLLGCDVIVIDDASTDATAAAAGQAGAKVLSLTLQLGAWGATQAGIRYALKAGYNIAVTLDSDGQHLASSIPLLLAPIEDGRADVVIGAYPQRGSRSRQIAWSFFRLLTGLKHEDLTSGLRAYNRPAIAALATRAATLLDYQDLGVLLLLRKSAFIILEVPVVMHPRAAGKSRVFKSWLAVLGYLLQTVVLCLSKLDLKTPINKHDYQDTP